MTHWKSYTSTLFGFSEVRFWEVRTESQSDCNLKSTEHVEIGGVYEFVNNIEPYPGFPERNYTKEFIAQVYYIEDHGEFDLIGIRRLSGGVSTGQARIYKQKQSRGITSIKRLYRKNIV